MWAQETKNLIAEIKTGHRDRAVRIGEIKSATKDILSDADAYMKQVAADLKEAAKNLRDFLAKSEETRKKDFDVLFRDIKGDVKDFLSKSEEKRMVDFKALMKDVTGAVEAIENATKTLLGNYKAERKEAAGYWGRLKGKEAAVAEEAVAEEAEKAPKKRGRKKK